MDWSLVILKESTQDGQNIGIKYGKEINTTEPDSKEEDKTLGYFWSVVFTIFYWPMSIPLLRNVYAHKCFIYNCNDSIFLFNIFLMLLYKKSYLRSI